MKRRNFLKLLGIAPAAPLAAKASEYLPKTAIVPVKESRIDIKFEGTFDLDITSGTIINWVDHKGFYK